MKVFGLMATTEVSGPCRGLFQLVKEAQKAEVRYVLGMFAVRPADTTPAIEEARRRGFRVSVLAQERRYDPKLIPQAWNVVREEDATVLQSHGYKPALLAWCLKHVTGLPWVAFSHGYTSENRRMALYNRLDTWLLRRADRVVVMSHAMGQWMQEQGVAEERIQILHNAVDIEDHRPEAEGRAFRSLYRVDTDDLLVGVIGRLSPEKGQREFLRAFKEVVRVVPDVKAVLVGDGQDRPLLETQVAAAGLKNRVIFAGYQRDMSDIYAALDVVVIPSLSEGLPNVLLEAMLHRKAVVATAVGGIPEVIPSVLSSLLVSPGDLGALARGMIRCLRDPALRLTYGELGGDHVRQHFSPARRAQQMVDLYRSLAPVGAVRREA
jgi:glycosyltransferase involved in cell wall biosynthesis